MSDTPIPQPKKLGSPAYLQDWYCPVCNVLAAHYDGQRPWTIAEAERDWSKHWAVTHSEVSIDDDIRVGLEAVGAQVEKTWRSSDYPAAMQGDTAQFRHAHLHAMKALGKIAALIDHQDHERMTDKEAVALRAELPKLLADIIRCAAKMAEVAPVVPVRIAHAYTERARQLAIRWGHGAPPTEDAGE